MCLLAEQHFCNLKLIYCKQANDILCDLLKREIKKIKMIVDYSFFFVTVHLDQKFL
jgi:hypothetical protein